LEPAVDVDDDVGVIDRPAIVAREFHDRSGEKLEVAFPS
jgi:hypothetical protein